LFDILPDYIKLQLKHLKVVWFVMRRDIYLCS